MKVIAIRNSPQPEPAFVIPGDATPDDVAAALRALRHGGLDAEVVPLVNTQTVAEFNRRIASFAREAATEVGP